jgi:hypothetical protein
MTTATIPTPAQVTGSPLPAFKTFIHPAAIRACLYCASDDGARYTLCSVQIEFEPERTLYVSTDGRCIGIVAVRQHNDMTRSFLLRDTNASELLKHCQKTKCREMAVAVIDGRKLTVESSDSDGRCYGCTSMDMSFPRWQQVAPKKDWVHHEKCSFGINGKYAGIGNKFWGALLKDSECFLMPFGPPAADGETLEHGGFIGIGWRGGFTGQQAACKDNYQVTFFVMGASKAGKLLELCRSELFLV